MSDGRRQPYLGWIPTENPWVFMWRDVVMRAIQDANEADPELARDAIEWMTCEEDGERTFIWCCNQGEMDPEYVRRQNGLLHPKDVARRMPSRERWVKWYRYKNATKKLKKLLDRERHGRNTVAQKGGR